MASTCIELLHRLHSSNQQELIFNKTSFIFILTSIKHIVLECINELLVDVHNSEIRINLFEPLRVKEVLIQLFFKNTDF